MPARRRADAQFVTEVHGLGPVEDQPDRQLVFGFEQPHQDDPEPRPKRMIDPSEVIAGGVFAVIREIEGFAALEARRDHPTTHRGLAHET